MGSVRYVWPGVRFMSVVYTAVKNAERNWARSYSQIARANERAVTDLYFGTEHRLVQGLKPQPMQFAPFAEGSFLVLPKRDSVTRFFYLSLIARCFSLIASFSSSESRFTPVNLFYISSFEALKYLFLRFADKFRILIESDSTPNFTLKSKGESVQKLGD